MLEHVDVIAERDRVLELEILVVNLIDITARLADPADVKAGVVRSSFERRHDGLGGGL